MTTVGVRCGACGADLGETARIWSDDSRALFEAHIPDCPFGGESPATTAEGDREA
jgi:hypothetical protein